MWPRESGMPDSLRGSSLRDAAMPFGSRCIQLRMDEKADRDSQPCARAVSYYALGPGDGGSVGEELGGDRGEGLVELEDPAVAGVGVDDQLTVLDAAMQVLGED